MLFRSESRGTKRAKQGCSFCRSQGWSFGRVFAHSVYSSSAAKASRLMKEPSHESFTRNIGSMLANWLLAREDFSPVQYDCIVPIPQHWMRRITHRYNHAAVLAEWLSRGLEIPYSESYLIRSRWTSKQGLKTISERRENLKNAFQVKSTKSLRYQSILIVDDVMTSGATLQDASRVLRAGGARHVDAVVFARGVNANRPIASQAVSFGRTTQV